MKPVVLWLILVPVLLGIVGVVAGGGWLAWKVAQINKEDAKATGFQASMNVPPPPVVGPQIGTIAPEIEGEDLDGKRFKLSDYRGKVVVLDFWGHW